jgi:hypothetical protein
VTAGKRSRRSPIGPAALDQNGHQGVGIDWAKGLFIAWVARTGADEFHRRLQMPCHCDGEARIEIGRIIELQRGFLRLAAVPRGELQLEMLPQVRETRRCSDETLISRLSIKAIVKAVDILDRPRRQFLKINLVEQGNLNSVENAAHGFHFAPPRRANAAYFAEMKLDRRPGFPRRRPLIVRLGLGARGKAIAAARDDGQPRPSFSAARTVALYRSLGDVDFGFEANSAAVAAAGVNFQGHVGAFTLTVEMGSTIVALLLRSPNAARYAATCFSSPMGSRRTGAGLRTLNGD